MLATVAFEAGIIAPRFFTALVITAILTSQFAGWWLDRALRSRGEIMGEPVGGTAATTPPGNPSAAPT